MGLMAVSAEMFSSFFIFGGGTNTRYLLEPPRISLVSHLLVFLYPPVVSMRCYWRFGALESIEVPLLWDRLLARRVGERASRAEYWRLACIKAMRGPVVRGDCACISFCTQLLVGGGWSAVYNCWGE